MAKTKYNFVGRDHLPWRWIWIPILACLPRTGFPSSVYTLSSGNSAVAIDTASQTGMNNWTVDGQNQLNQQWFWYRVGSSGPEASIDTIGMPTVNQLSANILNTSYASSQFSVSVLYSLVGGASGSGVSDVSETITIQNLTSSSLSFHFFQYADFDLGGTPNNDTAHLDQSGTSSTYSGVVQYNNGGCRVSENVDTVVSQSASRAQVATDNSLLAALNNLTPTTLTDNTSCAGNVKWALEWDKTIARGGTLIISKDMNIDGVPQVTGVPEPPAWSLLSSTGMIAWGLRKRLRRAR
jgi:hypothetical protein